MNAEATAAARGKKAAKKARRKERDAALTCVAEPPRAAPSSVTDGGSAASAFGYAIYMHACKACSKAAMSLIPRGHICCRPWDNRNGCWGGDCDGRTRRGRAWPAGSGGPDCPE